jgi:hypothetical protein
MIPSDLVPCKGGFAVKFRTQTVYGRTWLWIESSRIGECMAYYREKRLYGIAVVTSQECYDLKSLDFLWDYPDVRVISVSVNPLFGPVDLSGLRALTDLRALRCSVPLQLDAAAHPCLEDFSGEWLPQADFTAFPRLRKLALYSFRPRSRDISGLRVSDKLQELRLVKPGIDSLAGIERIAGLRTLELYYLRKKVSDYARIGALAQLETLDLESCRGIVDYGFLCGLSRLKKLMLTKCSDLPNVRFVESLPRLVHFSFVETTVSDGDLRPLLNIPYVGFDSKRSYSHTFAQFERRAKSPH